MSLTRRKHLFMHFASNKQRKCLHKSGTNTHFSQSAEALISLSEGKLNSANIPVIFRDNKVAALCILPPLCVFNKCLCLKLLCLFSVNTVSALGGLSLG